MKSLAFSQTPTQQDLQLGGSAARFFRGPLCCLSVGATPGGCERNLTRRAQLGNLNQRDAACRGKGQGRQQSVFVGEENEGNAGGQQNSGEIRQGA
jgi:hypothetical protein